MSYCSNCGNKVGLDEQYCSNCGNKISYNEQTPSNNLELINVSTKNVITIIMVTLLLLIAIGTNPSLDRFTQIVIGESPETENSSQYLFADMLDKVINYQIRNGTKRLDYFIFSIFELKWGDRYIYYLGGFNYIMPLSPALWQDILSR